MTDSQKRPEESLDPSDWAAFRALAHRMVDDSLDHLESLGERAPWQPMPGAVRTALTAEPLPRRTAIRGESVRRIFLDERSSVHKRKPASALLGLDPGQWDAARHDVRDMLAAGNEPALRGFGPGVEARRARR